MALHDDFVKGVNYALSKVDLQLPKPIQKNCAGQLDQLKYRFSPKSDVDVSLHCFISVQDLCRFHIRYNLDESQSLDMITRELDIVTSDFDPYFDIGFLFEDFTHYDPELNTLQDAWDKANEYISCMVADNISPPKSIVQRQKTREALIPLMMHSNRKDPLKEYHRRPYWDLRDQFFDELGDYLLRNAALLGLRIKH